jgi:hypothetical protein
VKFLGTNEKGQTRLSRRAVLLRDSNPTTPGDGAVVEAPVASTPATPAPETPVPAMKPSKWTVL